MALSSLALANLNEPIPASLKDDIANIDYLSQLKKMSFVNKLQFINQLNNIPIFYFNHLNIRRNAWTNHIIFLYRLENLYHLCSNLPQEYIALWNYKVLPKENNYRKSILERCFLYSLNWGNYIIANQLLKYVARNKRKELYDTTLVALTNTNAIKYLVEEKAITPLQAIEKLATDGDINLQLIKEFVQQLEVIQFDTLNNALTNAIKNNQIQTITYLIVELQAGITGFDENLKIITEGRFTEILKIVLNNLVAIGGTIITELLQFAVDEDSFELFHLIESKASLTNIDLNILNICCSEGKDEFIIYLLDKYNFELSNSLSGYFRKEGNNSIIILDKCVEKGYSIIDRFIPSIYRRDDDCIHFYRHIINNHNITIEQIRERLSPIPSMVGISTVQILVENGIKDISVSIAKQEVFEYLNTNGIYVDYNKVLISSVIHIIYVNNNIEFAINNGATNLEEAFEHLYWSYLQFHHEDSEIFTPLKTLIEMGYDPPQYMLNKLMKWKKFNEWYSQRSQ